MAADWAGGAASSPQQPALHEMLYAWRQAAAVLRAGEITQEEYDRWRYRYPEFETSGKWHKVVPSQELGDMPVKSMNQCTHEEGFDDVMEK